MKIETTELEAVRYAEPPTLMEVAAAIRATLVHFVGRQQLRILGEACRGEEGAYFRELLVTLAKRIEAMPKVYEQDSKGDQAIVHLHYFRGAMDWHITKRDTTAEQIQAFGLANLGYGAELGYISVQELIENNVELDLHWTPTTLAKVKESA